MKIGIIGSGVVGQTLGAKLVALGHDVVLGTRDPQKLDEKKNMAVSLKEWLASVQNKAKVVTFKEAAAHGDVLITCTHGQISVEALKLAEADKVGAKVLIDTANELDFSKGFPPMVLASQDRSVGENIQKAFPNLKVVKTLNTMAAPVMVNPKAVAGGDHTIFMAGNDKDAKTKVADLLQSFGWSDILDLGDISAARGPEMYMGMWIRLYGTLQNGMINIKVQR
ncbi:MAG TPA: NAD(P)-binding domain-containing protein [bacterium]|jgi:predicted dinucleotide-binding enzyme|nr:NAD(P)-binding domain-containing protein [bacterium]